MDLLQACHEHLHEITFTSIACNVYYFCVCAHKLNLCSFTIITPNPDKTIVNVNCTMNVNTIHSLSEADPFNVTELFLQLAQLATVFTDNLVNGSHHLRTFIFLLVTIFTTARLQQHASPLQKLS